MELHCTASNRHEHIVRVLFELGVDKRTRENSAALCGWKGHHQTAKFLSSQQRNIIRLTAGTLQGPVASDHGLYDVREIWMECALHYQLPTDTMPQFSCLWVMGKMTSLAKQVPEIPEISRIINSVDLSNHCYRSLCAGMLGVLICTKVGACGTTQS